MTDRVYPSAKPTTNPPAAFPTTKSQLYGATRPAYRPQPKAQPRRRRSCCCACFLWTTLIVIALLLLAAIAGAVVWVIYRPHRPTFSISSLSISSFNLTTPSSLDSRLDLSVSSRNPNKKLIFFYDPMSVSVSSNGVDVGDGSFPSFTHGTKNTTVLKTSVTSRGRNLDTASANTLSTDLKSKTGLPLEVLLETKVRVKMGAVKTGRVGIKISCDGINAVVSKGKTKTPVSSDTKCKVKLRIKIWKWQL